MATIFSPLSNGLYTIPKAQLIFFPKGSVDGLNMGDCRDVTINISVTEKEIYSNEYSSRTLAKKSVSEKKVEVSLTLAHMTAFARAASMMSDIQVDTQAAAASQSKTFTDVKVGGFYRLAHRAIAAGATVTDGAAVPFVEGTHYRLDRVTGTIEVMGIPAGADGDLKVAYSAEAINAGFLASIASNAGIRGAILVRGLNDDGIKSVHELWDVELRPSSARALISDQDEATIQLSGTAYPDGTRPSGQEIGIEYTA